MPGASIILVAMALHGLDVISADQSQIGFVGVPVLLVGTFVGLAHGAGEQSTAAMVGAGAGFVVGLAAGVALATLLGSLGFVVGGLWLVSTPVAMALGALVAVRSAIGARVT